MITSPGNETLKLVRKLRDRRWRDKLGLFVAEGEDLVDAAHAAGVEPVELLVAGETVEARLLADAVSLPHPPRVVGIFRRDDLRREPRGRGLALWRTSDPGNVGTLVRAADAFDACIALSPGCADPTSPKALRASAGAIFRVGTLGFDDAPGRRIGLASGGGRPLQEVSLEGEVCFVLGAEREGLPRHVADGCDELATIPLTPGSESLNVAMAGTVALYELARRWSPSLSA